VLSSLVKKKKEKRHQQENDSFLKGIGGPLVHLQKKKNALRKKKKYLTTKKRKKKGKGRPLPKKEEGIGGAFFSEKTIPKEQDERPL